MTSYAWEKESKWVQTNYLQFEAAIVLFSPGDSVVMTCLVHQQITCSSVCFKSSIQGISHLAQLHHYWMATEELKLSYSKENYVQTSLHPNTDMSNNQLSLKKKCVGHFFFRNEYIFMHLCHYVYRTVKGMIQSHRSLSYRKNNVKIWYIVRIKKC